jgi:phosphatidylglycerophosphate synthase
MGELLDPLADKIFANSVIWSIFLYHDNSVYILIIAVLLSLRDVALIFGSVYIMLKKLSVSIGPLYISKVCTALLSSFCLLVLLFDKNNIYTHVLGYITVTIVCLSAIQYLKKLL